MMGGYNRTTTTISERQTRCDSLEWFNFKEGTTCSQLDFHLCIQTGINTSVNKAIGYHAVLETTHVKLRSQNVM